MIILGDNPFFGVNHASVERSKGYFASLKARDWSKAHATMRAALANDVDHFMVSTHAEAPELLASMQADADLRRFSVIPAVPYLYRLNGLVASRGVPGAVLQSMSYGTFARGVLGAASVPARPRFRASSPKRCSRSRGSAFRCHMSRCRTSLSICCWGWGKRISSARSLAGWLPRGGGWWPSR